MAEETMSLMEMAIMDAVRRGMIDRVDIGKHARNVVNDYAAAGPTLWTEPTARMYADTLDSLVEKGYLAWQTYLLQVELSEKGKQFVTDSSVELESLPKVDDSPKWFAKQNKRIVR